MVIGKNTLKLYSFEARGIEGYFNYIIESRINGNNSQVKELYKRLSKNQKEDFYNWLKLNAISFDFSGML